MTGEVSVSQEILPLLQVPEAEELGSEPSYPPKSEIMRYIYG